MTTTRKWSALAALLVVAIFAGGWFLLISPKRGEAAELRQQATSKADQNAGLEQQIAMLQEQQKDLPNQRATLATLRTRIPDNPALPALIRDLTAAARKVGVSIDSMAPSSPVPLVAAPLAQPVADPAAAESDTSGTDASASDSTTTPVTPRATAPSLYQVPVTLNITGSYFELEQFLNKLENVKRSFLVTTFTVGEAKTEAAADGDLTIVLSGRVFISQAETTTTTTPLAATAASTGE